MSALHPKPCAKRYAASHELENENTAFVLTPFTDDMTHHTIWRR